MLAARNLDYGQLNASAGMHAGPAGLLSMYVLLPSFITIHHIAASLKFVFVVICCKGP